MTQQQRPCSCPGCYDMPRPLLFHVDGTLTLLGQFVQEVVIKTLDERERAQSDASYYAEEARQRESHRRDQREQELRLQIEREQSTRYDLENRLRRLENRHHGY